MMENKLIDTLQRMRAVGVPIVSVQTADQTSTVQTLRESLNGDSPLCIWDVVKGLRGLNKRGGDACAKAGIDDPEMCASPVEALKACERLVEDSIVLFLNAGRFIDDPSVLQGVMNLRDVFKANGRMLILLGPDVRLPLELVADVQTIDQPLPDDGEIGAVCQSLYSENKIKFDKALIGKQTDAMRGLGPFAVETAAALSIDVKSGKVDVRETWERKKRAIEQTKGLTLELPSAGFDKLGGLSAFKDFALGMGQGPIAPRCIVLIDEFEKAIAGAGGESSQGDTSGVSQDIVGVLLKEMEDHGHGGSLSLGPGGGGKTAGARAMAASLGIPLLGVDLNGCKDQYVGSSERNIRALMKTINAIAGPSYKVEGGAEVGAAYFIGTLNHIVNLSGPMRRRFNWGVYFFDLPDADERVAIGAIQSAAFGLTDIPEFWAACDGWSGANIRDCCKAAFGMGLKDVRLGARYVIPCAVQESKGLAALRAASAGAYMSASYEGVYRLPEARETETAAVSVRRINRGN